MKGFDVEQFDFTGNGFTDYVLIHVYVGKMAPNRISRYMENIKQTASICEELKRQDIPFDLHAVTHTVMKLQKPVPVKAEVTTGHDTTIDEDLADMQEDIDNYQHDGDYKGDFGTLGKSDGAVVTEESQAEESFEKAMKGI